MMLLSFLVVDALLIISEIILCLNCQKKNFEKDHNILKKGFVN